MTDLPQPTTQPPAPGQLTFTAPRRGKPPQHLADLDMDGRRAAVTEAGWPAFRASQLSKHFFERWTDEPAAMTDLPKAGREETVRALMPRLLTPVSVQRADDGATVKTLWRLHDGALVESVLMRYPRRVTLCLSSQAGCGMNCPFCATGQQGLTRNLSTAEIVGQLVAANRMLNDPEAPGLTPPPELAEGQVELGENDADPALDGTEDPLDTPMAAGGPLRVHNVVFMGMGEALANYRRAVDAVRRMVEPAPHGLGMSARGLTMSTVGLVPAIDKFAAEGVPATLALSLHAPDDELRDELVPINTRWNVDQALDAAYRYYQATGRRVSIEYALIRDINDHAWRADLLGEKLNARGRGWVHVNPIPLNPTPGSKWTASRPGVEQQFVERLRAAGIPTTVRDTRGSDIDGACGQLAAAPEGTLA
ncbi:MULTISPECIES: 23S rRNA (adenine(2503)-C(2))-methyltransferase RlmN [Kytococcus]|uniref:Probable dual-specificity RNA methyltransferase RlmN n=1 Tax=Kytococcus schroeteri TaxID=138300 RepID=A0A2I1PBK9_9MICO|nr:MULTISPECIES: 23S rRNA (adenine(2503)-C(2))-methyltransferase RlmN [Kytococcus]OFS14155.1 23S rRNA (adenine(2503)-C(2))-methyltransferase RlmN [Kytococcus sp. HMSC28H12]PKZ42018.1 dual-specificity RNA methyltransferase RlmN [Kytococcus schroeteri]